MTDSQYKALEWLEKYRRFCRQVESSRNTLKALEAIVNKCVSTYESDGSGSRDVETSKQQREDALLEYSKKRSDLEKEELTLLKWTMDVANAIKKMSDADHKDIATNLYLRNMKWEQCQEALHISRATLKRKRIEMLGELAKILGIR